MTYEPRKYKIISRKKINKDVILFRVKTSMNPKPGQFFEVSVPGIGECPLASCSYNKKYIEILLRNAGGVTNSIYKLKKNDFMNIRGPYGKGFPLKQIKDKKLIFIAGGTGIAPVTSLIEYAEKKVKNNKNSKIFFGFRNQEYILLKEKIKRWRKKFDLKITLDNPEKNWKGEKGFVPDTIKKFKPSVKNTLAFLCGPEVMMKKCTLALNELGLENKDIYWSLERRMECALGNCGRCLIQDVYTCKDGPVFRYDFIKPKLENEESNNENTE